jgi:hypothetical protein
MTYWNEYLVWVTADRNIHAVTAGGSVVELSSSDSQTKLDGGYRPSFVRGRVMLVISGGGSVQKWTGIGLSSRLQGLEPVGAPQTAPAATHVVGIAQRLVVMRPNRSGQIWWSGTLEEYENWDMSTGGASFLQAAAKPDKIVAMADNTNEIFTFGSETLQVFSPASVEFEGEVLDFTPSRTMNLGTLARDSVVQVDDMFAMLDRLRRIVLTDGRTVKELSEPIASDLADLAVVDDCWGFRMRFGRWDALVYVFPTAEKAFIYDLKTGKWSEWASWDRGPVPVAMTAAVRWEEHNMFMVGMADGTIATLDAYSVYDLGKPVRVELVTPFVAHDGPVQKHCKTVIAQFSRVYSGSGRVRISYRDDQGPWHVVEDVDLGYWMDPAVTIRSLGVYRQRQWKIEYTGGNDFVLASMVEEYDVLGA